MRQLAVHWLGRVGYENALATQERLAEARHGGTAGDTLLLLEHAPVVTLGRGFKREHLLFTEDALRARGVEVFAASRGGDVTYHGPGQLVGYPVLDLKPDRCDVRRYVRDLEEAMIRALADLGVVAERMPGAIGVFVGRDKIGAIGVHISRWITTHGFALNVSTDLSYTDLIVPCGLKQCGATSVEKILGRAPTVASVGQIVARHLAEILGARIKPPT